MKNTFRHYFFFIVSLMASFSSPHPLFLHLGENELILVYIFLVITIISNGKTNLKVLDSLKLLKILRFSSSYYF